MSKLPIAASYSATRDKTTFGETKEEPPLSHAAPKSHYAGGRMRVEPANDPKIYCIHQVQSSAIQP
jgi:hypothetical protein